jgi:hypothetical protein
LRACRGTTFIAEYSLGHVRGGHQELHVPAVRERVRYIVIGATAAAADPAPIPATRDIDFTPDARSDNLERSSLRCGNRRREFGPMRCQKDCLGPRRRVPWPRLSVEPRLPAQRAIFLPAQRLLEWLPPTCSPAQRVRVEFIEVSIADVDDISASKDTAGRSKDLQVLSILYRHRADRAAKEERT